MSEPRRNEVRAAARVVGQAVDILSRPVQGTHQAISRRVFGLIGPVATPVRQVHDAISDAAYTGVRDVAAAAAEAVGTASDALPEDAVSYAITDTASGSVVVGAVNGLLGDQLHDEASDLAVQFGPHVRRRRIGSSTLLFADGQAVTDHAVVLLHGLGETEQAWWYRSKGVGTIVAGLADVPCTPVLLRYNTGRAIEDNGREFARVMAEVVEQWPGELRRIDLVGHSMGGLVLRHACADPGAGKWLPFVRTACYLGTPHYGAPLAIGVERLARLLQRIPEGRAIGELLDVRSVGIDDLIKHVELPLVPDVHHVSVIATLAENPDTHWANWIGDGLVTLHSAKGPVDEAVTLPSTGHLRLLSHPKVAAVVRSLVTAAD